jgi:hypothetical protein
MPLGPRELVPRAEPPSEMGDEPISEVVNGGQFWGIRAAALADPQVLMLDGGGLTA